MGGVGHAFHTPAAVKGSRLLVEVELQRGLEAKQTLALGGIDRFAFARCDWRTSGERCTIAGFSCCACFVFCSPRGEERPDGLAFRELRVSHFMLHYAVLRCVAFCRAVSCDRWLHLPSEVLGTISPIKSGLKCAGSMMWTPAAGMTRFCASGSSIFLNENNPTNGQKGKGKEEGDKGTNRLFSVRSSGIFALPVPHPARTTRFDTRREPRAFCAPWIQTPRTRHHHLGAALSC